MEPIKIIESAELLLAGCLIKNEGGNEWAKWEEMDSMENDDARYAHHHIVDGSMAREVRFYPEDGEYVFTGLEVTQKTDGTMWEYLKVPAALFAVFDVDYKIDAQPQFHAIDQWLADNESKYTQMSWDADGRIANSIFILCVFDHNGKFGNDRIMEMWIPLVNVE